MDIAGIVFLGIAIAEGITLGVLLTGWGRKRIAAKVIKLAKEGRKDYAEIERILRTRG